MKLKIALLAVFALGIGSSIALAQAGRTHDHGGNGDCHKGGGLQGNVAPFTLTLTVTHSHEGEGGVGGVTTGQVVTVAVGSAGQIVSAQVEGGCSTGTGASTTTFTARNVHLRVVTQKPDTSTGKEGDDNEQGDDDDQGESDHHGTTIGTTTKTTTTTHS